jgi:cell division septal protein FtsQ
MSKNKYRSEKFEKRKKQILIRRIIWSFILFLFLLGGLIYWMNTDSLRISSIEVSDLKFADEKQIKSEIEKIISGK